jgi:hypothetical protein
MKFDDDVKEIKIESPVKFKVSQAKEKPSETNLLKFYDESPGFDPDKSFDSNRPPS